MKDGKQLTPAEYAQKLIQKQRTEEKLAKLTEIVNVGVSPEVIKLMAAYDSAKEAVKELAEQVKVARTAKKEISNQIKAL